MILAALGLIEPAAAAFGPSGTSVGWLTPIARVPGGELASALAFLGLAALIGFLAGVLPRRGRVSPPPALSS